MKARPELRKIMVVEDDQDLRAIARFSLEKVGGFTVRLCGSGHEALSEFAAFSPDLILMDFTLPDMNGIEALQRIGETAGEGGTCAAFFSAGAKGEEVTAIKAVRILGSVSKPFDPMSLPSVLRALWEGSDSA